jgi:hypothetical protein
MNYDIYVIYYGDSDAMYDFYKSKNVEAAKYAWFKLLFACKLPMQKATFGILYNIYFKNKF